MASSKKKPKTKTEVRSTKAPAKTVRLAKPVRVGFAVGDKVSHKIFGIGRVVDCRDDKLSIKFSKTITKEILVDYVSAI